MAQNSGKTLRAGAGLRQLNLPEAIAVEESASGEPVALLQEGQNPSQSPFCKGRGFDPSPRQVIQAIEGCWRIDDEWWRSEPVSRLYYAVILTSGQRMVVYKDLVKRNWYRQEY